MLTSNLFWWSNSSLQLIVWNGCVWMLMNNLMFHALYHLLKPRISDGQGSMWGNYHFWISFLFLFSFFNKEELVNILHEWTVNASIASRPCGFDPLSQCYNKNIERTLACAHAFTLISKYTFSSAGFASNKKLFHCRGRERFWFHVFVNIFSSVLVCRTILTGI